MEIKYSPAPLDARRKDVELIERLVLRDESALRTLIDLCGKHIYSKALQILIEPQLAEEVAQDTLLILWWHPERWDRSKGSIRSFLLGVARYKAIDAVRREETIRSKEALLTEVSSFFEAPQTGDEVENAVVVRATISHLPLAKREVIFLAFYKGLTYREVGQVLSLPEGTVKTRIRDALARLRVAMEIERGGTA